MDPEMPGMQAAEAKEGDWSLDWPQMRSFWLGDSGTWCPPTYATKELEKAGEDFTDDDQGCRLDLPAWLDNWLDEPLWGRWGFVASHPR